MEGQQFVPISSRGILYSFACLFFLSFMPIISQSRPSNLSALDFALYLSLWELFFSFPLLGKELRQDVGIFSSSTDVNVRRRTISIIFLTGIIFTITTFLYVFSFEVAGTVSAAIALQAYPLFSLLLEAALLRQFKSKKEVGFTLILVSAIYYLATGGTWRINDFSGWFALVLLVPFLWSVAHIIIKQLLGTAPITPGQITFIRVLTSSVILGIVVTIQSGITHIIAGLTVQIQLFGMIMGLFYYSELVFWFYALKHIDVSLASAVTTPAPVFTALLALLFLKENILGYQVIAMGVTVLSLYGLLAAVTVK